MANEIEVVVAGLSNYISKDKSVCDAWARSLTPGTPVLLEWEPENPFTPGCAFKAYVAMRMVGRVSKDDCFKLLCLKDDEGLVLSRLLWGKDKELHVAVVVPDGVSVPQRLSDVATALTADDSIFPQGLNLPITEAESRLKLALRLLPVAPTTEVVDQWCHDVQRTMSCEVMSSLPTLCQQLASQFPEQAELVNEWYKDMGKGPAIAHQIWQNLLDDLRLVAQTYGMYDRWANFFFGENAASPTAEQLSSAKEQLEAWLEHLPHAIWKIYHHDTAQWAQMLSYQQPKRDILYRICTHILAIEYINTLINSNIANIDASKQSASSALTVSESVSESAHPAPVLTDPDCLFDSRRTLPDLYHGICRAANLVVDGGDWGLLALALSDEEGIEACAQHHPLALASHLSTLSFQRHQPFNTSNLSTHLHFHLQ